MVIYPRHFLPIYLLQTLRRNNPRLTSGSSCLMPVSILLYQTDQMVNLRSGLCFIFNQIRVSNIGKGFPACVGIQTLIFQHADEALGQGVLTWFTRPDEVEFNTSTVGPFIQGTPGDNAVGDEIHTPALIRSLW